MPDQTRIRGLALRAAPLFGFWLILSGKFDPFHLGLGLLTAIGVSLATRRLGRTASPGNADERGGSGPAPTLRAHRFPAYALWLVGQILRSALEVAKLVLDPRLPISPRLVRIEDRLQHPLARLALAHSITLTPGTVTIDCDEDGMLVHAIDRERARGLERGGGSMAERIRRLFATKRRRPLKDPGR